MNTLRKFDHDNARRRRAAGETVAALAAEYGVTQSAIRLALTPERNPHRRVVQKAWQTTTCEDCGGPALKLAAGKAKHNTDGLTICRGCRSKRRRERVRFDDSGTLVAVRCANLDCANGDRWQPPENFPGGSRFKDVREGGIHNACRACGTRQRRKYREARKIPCSHGCGALVFHERRDLDKPPECRTCANSRTARAGMTGRASAKRQPVS